MRPFLLSLVVLATGCATAPRAIPVSQRLAELKRMRQMAPPAPTGSTAQVSEPPPSAPEDSNASPPEASSPPEPPPVPEPAPAAPEAPEPPPAPPAPPSAPPAPPSAPAVEPGPRKGALGVRGSLFGGALSVEGGVSRGGVRYFVSDSVGLNLEAGFTLGSVKGLSVTGLSLGAGVNAYSSGPEATLRPFFSGSLGLTSLTSGPAGLTTVSLAVGGGLEYWVLPHLSLDAGLQLGLSLNPSEQVFVLGTVHPGVGVTLYIP